MVAATSVSLEALAGAVYFISLVIVLWALLDMLRRPRSQLNPIQKLGWSIALVIGWLLPFGILGACLGLAYLGPVRRGLNAGAAAPVEAPLADPVALADAQRARAAGPPAGLVSGPLGRAGDPLVGRGRLDPAHAGVGPDQSSASSGFANRAGGRAPL